MNRINEVVHGIHYLDAMSAQDKWINHIHPLAKVLVTFIYIVAVVSFDKYNIAGLAGMSIYLFAMAILGEISMKQSLKQIKVVLLLVCIVGIANPFFDKSEMGRIGTVVVTGGVISMFSIMLKGMFTVFASYLLIVTTSIEKICYALRLLHIPKVFVTLILLIYRYIIVILKDVERITQAYQLRAPGQKGIHIKAWGSLVGQLLLRSIDRAQVVYESMILRGYDGEFVISLKTKPKANSVVYFIIVIFIIILFRTVPVFEMVGNILT